MKLCKLKKIYTKIFVGKKIIFRDFRNYFFFISEFERKKYIYIYFRKNNFFSFLIKKIFIYILYN